MGMGVLSFLPVILSEAKNLCNLAAQKLLGVRPTFFGAGLAWLRITRAFSSQKKRETAFLPPPA
jgi:hypothetical protein